MRVLIIDPWLEDGKNLYFYTTGLAGGLSKKCTVTVIGSTKLTKPDQADYKVKKLFFPFSNYMKVGALRRIVRGIEYILAYLRILIYAMFNNFDVIHIEWPLLYRFDAWVFRRLAKQCHTFVIKAHNVLPHSTGEKYLIEMKKIYACGDVVLVHGEPILKDFQKIFPDLSEKVRVQRFGIHMNHDMHYDLATIPEEIQKKVNEANKVLYFFGRFDFDKGLDLLADYWYEDHKNDDNLLVVTGLPDSEYEELKTTRRKLKDCNNVIFIEQFIPNYLLNYFVDHCNAVLLPYRKGYVSAGIFTAAEFYKPVVATQFGAISEYVISGETGIISNSFDQYRETLTTVCNMSNKRLKEMGKLNGNYIRETCNWDYIAEELSNKVYSIKYR